MHAEARARKAGIFADCMPGIPIGALRASLGIPSNDEDVRRLIALVASVAEEV